MSTNTSNLNLVKPDKTELADIDVINSNMDKIDALYNRLFYKPGETVSFPRGFGCLTGIKANDTTLHLAIPVAKRMSRTPSLESNHFSIITWYENGSKTLNTAPTSIEVIVANLDAIPLIVLRATYDASVIATLPREFAWRFNSVNDNYWKFTF